MTLSELAPPQDIDAERAVLGALMLGGALHDVPLRAEDFARRDHALIFAAIGRLAGRDAPTDAVTVRAELDAAGQTDSVGGAGVLLELCDAAVYAGNADGYARIVRDKARLRGAARAATLAVAAASRADADPEELRASLTAAVAALDGGDEKSGEPASEAVARRLEEYASPTPALMLPGTGTRLHLGDVCVIGGRPGDGKTALALAAADVWSAAGHSVLVLSFEMSVSELADRLVSRATGIAADFCYDGLGASQLTDYRARCAPLLARDTLHLRAAAGMSEAAQTAAIRRFASKGGEAVVIDYAQIACERRTDENADLTRYTRAIQQAAKSAGVLVLMVSQYARAATGGQPALHHLRGSGSLEQEAATCGLMWRPADDEQEDRKREVRGKGYLLDPADGRALVKLSWSKVRHGARGEDYLLFDGRSMSFETLDREAPR